MATFYNFTGYQGDYIQLTLNVVSSSGTPISFSGYDVRGQVRADYGSTGILLNLNPIVNVYSGNASSISIDSYVSQDVPVGDFVYDVERFPSGIPTGNSIKLLRGIISILPEVTR
jgi:hypothetical protein